MSILCRNKWRKNGNHQSEEKSSLLSPWPHDGSEERINWFRSRRSRGIIHMDILISRKMLYSVSLDQFTWFVSCHISRNGSRVAFTTSQQVYLHNSPPPLFTVLFWLITVENVPSFCFPVKWKTFLCMWLRWLIVINFSFRWHVNWISLRIDERTMWAARDSEFIFMHWWK